MADPKILGGLGKMGKRLLMTEEEKLAQKYAAGAQYADPLAPATMRMSEALGNVGAEGKTLNFTEADRSRVFGSNRGGVGFSGLQHYSLPHKKANTVWGFGNKNTADKKVKQNDPEKSIWTTFVGSPNQHKSNTVVLKDAIKEFQDAVKAGNVPAGQIKLMNDRIRAATDDKTGALLFDDAFDLTDLGALGAANTFGRRSAVGDVLLGEGVKGPMRGKAFKAEYGNQPWQDSGKMDSILRRETDPDLVDAGTYDVGNRFFVMDGKIIERSDLNEAFPLQVTGNDLGIKYQLVPPNKAMRDFYKSREGRKDKNNRDAPVNYYDLSRAEPSQFVDEDYLTFLQKEGHKDGGAIDIEAADARLEAAMNRRMAKGGSVDIDAADARLEAAMNARMGMAQGGEAGFKKIEFMQAGGIAKGLANIGKKLLASGDEAPKVDRLSMSYKDVTKRVPEVADAIEKLNRGEITRAQYNDIVNLYKPVTPYSFVPKPATKEEAVDALRGDAAKSRYGAQAEYTPGSKVGLRLDIPAYTGKGVWVNSIHDETAKKVAYGPVASVKNANLSISQNESKRIALGGAKAPYAKIKGEWNPMSEEEAVAKAQEYLNHPEWRQIGMDPERHSYFYDRATMTPITGAEEVIQIGPLVLGKNPKFGKIEDFEYASGGYATMLPFADGGKIVKGGLNIARRLFKTTDGYTFKEMPDGRVTNGDMTWNSVKEFKEEMPHAFQQSDELGQRRANMESFGRPDPQNIPTDIGRFMPDDAQAQFLRALNKQNLPKPQLSVVPTEKKAEGGGAFKKLQWSDAQHFDGGGIASPEETTGYSAEPFTSSKRWDDIKKNASEMFDKSKQSLADDYDRLKNSGRARAQLAKISAAQIAGGAPDLAHLGVNLILDPLKSVTIDKVLTKPRPRSVLEGPPKAGEKQERVPMFGSLSEALTTEDGLPIGGSEHMIKRAQDAGLMYGSTKPFLDESGRQVIDPETGLPLESRTGRFGMGTEIGSAILGGAGLSKLSKGAVKGYNKLTGEKSVKLYPLQPEAMTAPAGTPQGATYATKQEGPFYRVSPTSHDLSGAKSRGLREADELQGQASVGSGAGQAGSEVPLRISDEEVARLISDPASNQPLQIAQRFTKDTQGTDFAKPDIPESSLAKQSAIGRAHQLAVEGSPEYKSSVFDAYAKQMPDVLEQAGAKNYDDLMEKAYRQLAKETDEQFKQLPYNFSYHRAGEGDYLGGSKEMMADVHGNKHLYVFQGGDPHDFLNRMDKASGLNENEKFRAVHDLLGHAIYGNQFGPKGEELAYAVHQQMYSPLARLAMASETRGQNSLVNYSPLNVKLKTNIAKLEDLEVEAMRRGNKDLVNEIRAAKRQEFANNFQFAPQKAVLLPPEFIDPKFAGGLPDYLSAANRPTKGTKTQSVLTHFSNDPNLQLLDPTRYGTGIKGAEAERLRDYAGGVKDRSYVYLGEPGTIAPESGLGVNRYRGESQNLYDITKDPLSFRALARESNRTPFTAKVNAGITSPLQEANDYERLVKEYGYEGMINPNASKPMGIMFKPTPVQPRKRGGLTQLRAR